jgi:hypothetical protein
MTAHDTSQAAILARRKAIQERLLAERGLLPDGLAFWQQVEDDQKKRTIRIRNKGI